MGQYFEFYNDTVGEENENFYSRSGLKYCKFHYLNKEDMITIFRYVIMTNGWKYADMITASDNDVFVYHNGIIAKNGVPLS